MLNFIAIILGLISWMLLIYTIVKRKALTKEKTYMVRLVAWVFCTVSIYIPSIILSIWVKKEAISNLLDCTFGYHFGASVLLVLNIILTIISIVSCRKND